MKCIHCKGELKKGDTPLHIDCHDCRVPLDNAPAWVCMQCGESYFENAEVDTIQVLFQTTRQRSVKMSQKPQGIDWLAENRNALEAFNRRIELDDVFSDGLRRF